MYELKIGDKLKDNDPRMGDNRILTIVEILPNGVVAENCIGQRRRYLRKRIHTDGKPRQSGMNLLMPNIVSALREYADAAEAGEKRHWAKAMREAAQQLRSEIEIAAKANRSTEDNLHVCGQCNGTGYVA